MCYDNQVDEIFIYLIFLCKVFIYILNVKNSFRKEIISNGNHRTWFYIRYNIC